MQPTLQVSVLCGVWSLVFALCHCHRCGQSPVESHTRIVGGQYSKVHQFPWLAHYRAYYVPLNIPTSGGYTIKTMNCGGSLVDSHWLVTAAHCIAVDYSPFEGYRHNHTTVTLGAHNLTSNDELTLVVRAKQIYVHPKYTNKTYQYDIALVRLETTINFEQTNYKIAPICLPASGEVISRTECQIAGWGDVSKNVSGDGVLKMANVELHTAQECRGAWPQFDESLEVCSDDATHATCQGDSGGPLQCRNDDGQWVLTGVTSFGSKTQCGDRAGVYTKVLGMLDWINHIRQDNV